MKLAKTEEKRIEEPEETEEKLAGEFTLKKENSKILKGVVETLANIIDEGYIKITKQEFIVEAMDPSRICLLKLSINQNNFDEFTCSKSCKIGLNLDDLDKILKRATANDSIELSYKAEDQKLKIRMKRDDTERARNFSLALLDIEYEEVPMDNLEKIEYNNIITIDPDLLIEAIKDAEIYSEIFNLQIIENERLTFSSSGQIGEMSYEIGIDELLNPEIIEAMSGAYSITFLKSIMKISSITEKLEISTRTDHPLKMEFNILEGGSIKYWLAPRVDDENNDYDDDFMDEV